MKDYQGYSCRDSLLICRVCFFVLHREHRGTKDIPNLYVFVSISFVSDHHTDGYPTLSFTGLIPPSGIIVLVRIREVRSMVITFVYYVNLLILKRQSESYVKRILYMGVGVMRD